MPSPAPYSTAWQEQRRKAARNIVARVRAAHPDTYIVAGLGWCGPGWEQAAELEKSLRAAAGLD